MVFRAVRGSTRVASGIDDVSLTGYTRAEGKRNAALRAKDRVVQPCGSRGYRRPSRRRGMTPSTPGRRKVWRPGLLGGHASAYPLRQRLHDPGPAWLWHNAEWRS